MLTLQEEKEKLERAKSRLSGNLLNIIYSASQGQQYTNKESINTFIDEIVNASALKAVILINELAEKQKEK